MCVCGMHTHTNQSLRTGRITRGRFLSCHENLFVCVCIPHKCVTVTHSTLGSNKKTSNVICLPSSTRHEHCASPRSRGTRHSLRKSPDQNGLSFDRRGILLWHQRSFASPVRTCQCRRRGHSRATVMVKEQGEKGYPLLIYTGSVSHPSINSYFQCSFACAVSRSLIVCVHPWAHVAHTQSTIVREFFLRYLLLHAFQTTIALLHTRNTIAETPAAGRARCTRRVTHLDFLYRVGLSEPYIFLHTARQPPVPPPPPTWSYSKHPCTTPRRLRLLCCILIPRLT
ncbi:hypothetical protein HD554DRAFT_438839 [Boletus coccyginus]|nr:hypothetical protein HD554DRAFT_438839 [Boletus coccyginus]